MSTTEYLAKLNIDQLKFAKEESERLIRKIEAEDRVSLFIVEGTAVNEACYLPDQFNLAKEKLCELIMSDEFTESHVQDDHPKIVIQKVYESEVAGYMKLNA